MQNDWQQASNKQWLNSPQTPDEEPLAEKDKQATGRKNRSAKEKKETHAAASQEDYVSQSARQREIMSPLTDRFQRVTMHVLCFGFFGFCVSANRERKTWGVFLQETPVTTGACPAWEQPKPARQFHTAPHQQTVRDRPLLFCRAETNHQCFNWGKKKFVCVCVCEKVSRRWLNRRVIAFKTTSYCPQSIFF